MTQRTKPLFNPVTANHAIVETVFHIEFDQELTPEQVKPLQDAVAQSKNFQAFFPEQPKTLMGVKFERDGKTGAPTVNPAPAGIKMGRLADDRHLSWLLILNPAGLSIHCFDYTRWDDKDSDPVWPKANALITEFFSITSSAGIPLTRLALKYVDDFVMDGEMKNYDVNALLDRKSAQKLLPPNIFELTSPQRWHSHNGWFQVHATNNLGEVEILSQLNVMSEVQPYEDQNVTAAVRIEHSSALTLTETVLAEDELTVRLTKIYNFLHNQNKILVCRLLTREMRDRIKMKVDEDGARI